MWTLICPAWSDPKSEIPSDLDNNVLRCGETYLLGRKEADININRPWMSRKQGSFIVGPCIDIDAFNMEKTPSLEYHNTTDKECTVTRGDGNQTTTIPGRGTVLLKHMDLLFPHTKIGDKPIRCIWSDIVCFIEDLQVIRPQDCMPLGMKLCIEYYPNITVHVTELITGEPVQIPILLRGGSIVTKQWVTKLFDKLESGAEGKKSILKFKQPSREDCLPDFSPNLKPSLCQKGLWKQNTTRIDMFQQYKFIFLIERDLAQAWNNVMAAGGATCDVFNVHDGVVRWATHIAQAKRNANKHSLELILITDENAMDAAIGDTWKDYIRETQRVGLRFLPYSSILDAVLFVDKSRLKSAFDPGDAVSQVPDAVPGSLPDEASVVELTQERAGVTRRLPARRSPSAAIPGDDLQNGKEEEEAVGRSKLLRRRVRQGSVEPSAASSQMAAPGRADSPAVQTPIVDNPVNRAKLRRRNPTQVSETPEPESVKTSNLDEIRKVFEETDPDRRPAYSSQRPGTQGASQAVESLVDMVEQADQERRKALESAATRSRKRKAQDAVAEDPTTGVSLVQSGASASAPGVRSREGSAAPPSKKRVVSRMEPPNLDAVPEEQDTAPPSQTKPKTSQKPPKPTNQPDRDENFLKALASLTKGKKKEDQFDRDFNSLKIVKPIVDRNEEVDVDPDAWDRVSKDMNYKGSCFICIEMVPREPSQAPKRREGNPVWMGRPDFKKFKKKVPAKRSAIVDLVANLSIDGFEDDVPPHGDLTIDHDSGIRGKARPLRSHPVDMSDEDGSQEVEGHSGRAKSTARSVRTRQEELFMRESSSEDVQATKSVDDSDDDLGRTKASETKKRKVTVLARESSDEGEYRKRKKKKK